MKYPSGNETAVIDITRAEFRDKYSESLAQSIMDIEKELEKMEQPHEVKKSKYELMELVAPVLGYNTELVLFGLTDKDDKNEKKYFTAEFFAQRVQHTAALLPKLDPMAKMSDENGFSEIKDMARGIAEIMADDFLITKFGIIQKEENKRSITGKIIVKTDQCEEITGFTHRGENDSETASKIMADYLQVKSRQRKENEKD